MFRVNLLLAVCVTLFYGILGLGMANAVSPPPMTTIPLSLPATVSQPIWSDEEMKCLTVMIYGEARNQPFEGQVAVGAVAVNRSLQGSWAPDVCKVVKQKGQFHGYWNAPRSTRNVIEAKAWQTAARAAQAAVRLPGRYQGLYFFDSGGGGGKVTLAIKDHRFYSLRDYAST